MTTISLEDILPQIPIKKIRKVSGNWFRYFQLEGNLVISNGHIFFVIGLEYLEAVSNYANQLQKECLVGQIEITEFTNIPNHVKSVDDWVDLLTFGVEVEFNPSFYNSEYLKLMSNNPTKTLQYISLTWVSQISFWTTPEMTLILTGILQHRK